MSGQEGSVRHDIVLYLLVIARPVKLLPAPCTPSLPYSLPPALVYSLPPVCELSEMCYGRVRGMIGTMDRFENILFHTLSRRALRDRFIVGDPAAAERPVLF